MLVLRIPVGLSTSDPFAISRQKAPLLLFRYWIPSQPPLAALQAWQHDCSGSMPGAGCCASVWMTVPFRYLPGPETTVLGG